MRFIKLTCVDDVNGSHIKDAKKIIYAWVCAELIDMMSYHKGHTNIIGQFAEGGMCVEERPEEILNMILCAEPSLLSPDGKHIDVKRGVGESR